MKSFSSQTMFEPGTLSFFRQKTTPFYYYDLELLRETLEKLKEATSPFDFKVHYALKANVNDKILSLINSYGLGADCVSGNEILKAVEAGFTNDKIIFAGVGKSDKEIEIALNQDIACFNVESIPELRVINEIASMKSKVAPIALRINPNVNANTHHYITTGLEENKFGINAWEFDDVIEALQDTEHIRLLGLHFHIGSQITDLNIFKSLCLRVNEIQSWFNDRNIFFESINVGGGLGVDYENPVSNAIPDFDTFFKIFAEFLKLNRDQELHFELGRAIVAQCGSLITKTLFVKPGINTNFAIVDAGMTELIRPALYQSFHRIENLSGEGETKTYDVVGPICESSDCFAKSMQLPMISRGDLLAIRSTGAYGEVMASSYNLRERVKAFYSDEIKK